MDQTSSTNITEKQEDKKESKRKNKDQIENLALALKKNIQRRKMVIHKTKGIYANSSN